MLVIKKVGVLSVAKIFGLFYGLMGLIGGTIFSCVSLIGTAAAVAGSDGDAFAMIFGVGAIIFLPIMYGIIGFIGGLITGSLYNVIAGRVGGIEIYTEKSVE